MPSTASSRSSARRPASYETDDAYENAAQFSRPRRASRMDEPYEDEYEAPRRARRGAPSGRDLVERDVGYQDAWDKSEIERPNPAERRSRRRRQPTSWLRRNALSLVAILLLLALVGVGFGIIQLLSRGQSLTLTGPMAAPAPTSLPAGNPPASVPTALPSSAPTVQAAVPPIVSETPRSAVPTVALASPTVAVQPTEAVTQAGGLKVSVKPIEANYTVQKGDSVYSLATKFNTTPERIQALNNLSDPRMLNVGQQLIIPPAL